MKRRQAEYSEEVKRFMELQELEEPTEAEVIEYNLLCEGAFKALNHWLPTGTLIERTEVLGISSLGEEIKATVTGTSNRKYKRLRIESESRLEWTVRFERCEKKQMKLVTSDLSAKGNITLANHTTKHHLPSIVHDPMDYAKAYFQNILLQTSETPEESQTGEKVS